MMMMIDDDVKKMTSETHLAAAATTANNNNNNNNNNTAMKKNVRYESFVVCRGLHQDLRFAFFVCVSCELSEVARKQASMSGKI